MWIFTVNYSISGNSVTLVYKIKIPAVEEAIYKLYNTLRANDRFPWKNYKEFREAFYDDGVALHPNGWEIRSVHPNDFHDI